MLWMNGCNAMLKWEKYGNPVNQRKLHTVHTLIFAKSTKVAHGRTRVNPLVPGLFSLKSAYRPEAYFGKLMYEGHLFLEMLLFCNPLTYNAV